jgi:hypothetical protein
MPGLLLFLINHWMNCFPGCLTRFVKLGLLFKQGELVHNLTEKCVDNACQEKRIGQVLISISKWMDAVALASHHNEQNYFELAAS